MPRFIPPAKILGKRRIAVVFDRRSHLQQIIQPEAIKEGEARTRSEIHDNLISYPAEQKL